MWWGLFLTWLAWWSILRHPWVDFFSFHPWWIKKPGEEVRLSHLTTRLSHLTQVTRWSYVELAGWWWRYSLSPLPSLGPTIRMAAALDLPPSCPQQKDKWCNCYPPSSSHPTTQQKLATAIFVLPLSPHFHSEGWAAMFLSFFLLPSPPPKTNSHSLISFYSHLELCPVHHGCQRIISSFVGFPAW